MLPEILGAISLNHLKSQTATPEKEVSNM